MTEILRKFHTFKFFHKYRRNVQLEVQIKEKNSIQGAYLLLKRFKNRLKVFDETLIKIEKQKVGMNDFNELKTSLRPERA